MTLTSIQKKLRSYNRKNYYLFFFCNTIALMLITAYSSMMFSPTVLSVLPKGGDSRKQMNAIFALTCVGCLVFTIYAANLFFRMKAKEIGLFLALGASRKKLAPVVSSEVLRLCLSSTVLGTALGIPFSFSLWQLFRLFVVDTEEMRIRYDLRCLLVSLIFIVIAVFAAHLMGLRYLKRSNLMDVLQEEHKNEPIPNTKKWFGPVGIVLILIGAVGGYFSPSLYMNTFSAYPPAWLNLTYLPVLPGLYMVLLHTLIYGWSGRRHPYKNIISRSMMKFQGRQTVNNMLIVTVLIAGCCFGIFYLPTMSSSQQLSIKSKEYDYAFHYRQDQTLPGQQEIDALAFEYDVTLKDFDEGEYLMLAVDGITEIEEGNRFRKEYQTVMEQGKFFSESTFNRMTNSNVNVSTGSYYAITNDDESAPLFINRDSTLLTDVTTGQTTPVTFEGISHNNLLALMGGWTGYYVLDDKDYEKISAGLSENFKGNFVQFNAGSNDSYAFSKALYGQIVDSFDESCFYSFFYDPVKAYEKNNQKKQPEFSAKEKNTADFQMYWAYKPSFRIMDQNDALKNTAVFMMMFLFIAIVCLTAAIIVCYTRCITIVMNNRYVFEDLKRLGAAPVFIKNEVKSQTGKVFFVPAAIGMSLMYLLYSMIMYANDGRITTSEILSLLICLGIVLILLLLIGCIYRMTNRKMLTLLNVR